MILFMCFETDMRTCGRGSKFQRSSQDGVQSDTHGYSKSFASGVNTFSLQFSIWHLESMILSSI